MSRFFSGNYGSQLGDTRTAANLLAQAGATQGQMFANMGQQLGGAISSTLEKFRMNKEKKETEQRAENLFIKQYESNPDHPIFKNFNINGIDEAKAVAKDLSKDPALVKSAMQLGQMAQQQEQMDLINGLRKMQMGAAAQGMAQNAQVMDQAQNQQAGQNQFSNFQLQAPQNESPEAFRKRVQTARDSGNLNQQGANLAANSLMQRRGAEAKASAERLASEEDFGRDVALEVVKQGLKAKPPQVEDAYKPGPDIMANNINRAYEIMDTDGFIPSTGFGGLLKAVPGTDAHRLGNLLQTIKGNIGFDYLQAMREASPTGGALGQVSNQELSTLQSVFGSLEQTQGEADLKYNLQLLNHVYNNIVHGEGGHDVPHPDGSMQRTGNAQGQPSQALLDEEARLQAMLKEREMSQQYFNTPPVQQFKGK